MPNLSIPQDLEYLGIFSLVLILPKILLRYKIPSGITALAIGVVAGSLDPQLSSDQLFRFLSQIGITSLFVFAGFEVDFRELKEDRVYLSKYLFKSLLIIGIISWAFYYFLSQPLQDSIIFALGIFTPSAGFIMNSLHSYKIGSDLEYWVKSKAISKEFIAIVLLFFAMQGGDWQTLGVSVLFFGALIFVLPLVFKAFFKFISPIAPNSELSFLVVLSLVAGVLSKEVGAYYLVGAFIVGLVASKFKHDFLHKEEQKTLFASLSAFFSVFLPFYFFAAGLKINPSELTLDAALIALALIVFFVPIRLLLIKSSIHLFMKEMKHGSFNISLSLMPTLVFGLIISGVLYDRGHIATPYIYALILYTVFTSILPSLLFPFNRNQESHKPQ